MNNKSYLLPEWFRIPGWCLFIAGVFLAVLNFMNIKLSFFNARVFAVHSSFIGSNYFKWINNNLQDEITIALLLISLMFIILARSKDESESLMLLRATSMILSLIINSAIILLLSFLVYGFSFIVILEFNLISFQVIFIIIFSIRKAILRNLPMTGS